MNDQMEERLGRSLDQQAAGLHEAPFALDDVRDRARSIRRRRRGVAAAVVAAVVAVALPVGLLAGGGEERAVDPADPAPTRAAVLHDDVVTLPDGHEVAAPYDEVTQLATLQDGRIVLMLPRRAVVLDAAGTELASYPVLVNDLTTGNNGAIAWIGADQRVRVLEPDRAEPATLARVPAEVFTVEAVIGDRCDEDLCQVYAGDGSAITHRVYADEAVPLDWEPPFDRITDATASGERWAVALPRGPDEQHPCTALFAPVESEIVARTCETSGLRFSPDEQHLLGQRGDNNMYGEVSVLDTDLRPVLTYRPDDGLVVSRAAWADAEHLEVAVVDPGTSAWSLVRVPIDGGAPEVLAGPDPGGNPEMVAEYVFTD